MSSLKSLIFNISKKAALNSLRITLGHGLLLINSFGETTMGSRDAIKNCKGM